MNRLLCITLSNIGDAVLTTPVLELMRRRHPEAVIDIVTAPRAAPVFEHFPWRGETILKRGHGVRSALALLRRLRRTRYDLVVDLRTDGLALLLRARRRLTRFGARALGPHAVERHLGVVHSLLDGVPPAVTIWTGEADAQRAAALLDGLPGERWLALGPGARWAPKRWPAERFAQLADAVRERFDALVLLGDAGDAAACAAIGAAAALPVANLAGRTPVTTAAAVLRRADRFVGNDSALRHIAAAVGTPSLTLFGPGDPGRYRPWGAHARWLRSPTGRLEDLPVGQVVAAASGFL
jgi:ADP-heptose:LPS heptosyltransferase